MTNSFIKNNPTNNFYNLRDHRQQLVDYATTNYLLSG